MRASESSPLAPRAVKTRPLAERADYFEEAPNLTRPAARHNELRYHLRCPGGGAAKRRRLPHAHAAHAHGPDARRRPRARRREAEDRRPYPEGGRRGVAAP